MTDEEIRAYPERIWIRRPPEAPPGVNYGVWMEGGPFTDYQEYVRADALVAARRERDEWERVAVKGKNAMEALVDKLAHPDPLERDINDG